MKIVVKKIQYGKLIGYGVFGNETSTLLNSDGSFTYPDLIRPSPADNSMTPEWLALRKYITDNMDLIKEEIDLQEMA